MNGQKDKTKEPEKPVDSPSPQTRTEPDSSRSSFPIVGIGASAGGLAAFETFFTNMPADSKDGMAFVLVQHLAPDHKSILTELVKRYTRMKVFEIEDGMEVRPNCTYIIPPNRDLGLLNGRLYLTEPVASKGLRMPIDFFFRSLAQDQQDRAICIVLSGTGSDGTLGVREIKGQGGMVMVQAPDSTEYDGMPRNVIATGLADYVLLPDQMPAQLMAYVGRVMGRAEDTFTPLTSGTAALFQKIFMLLRAGTGHDFSGYKTNTINRRVERRMAVNQIERLDDYIRYLNKSPKEVKALFQELLIGVTNFFRETGAFEVIEEKVIPNLFSGKKQRKGVRIWVPGCSTGEEAYSLAILLRERLEALKENILIQVFATDIDITAIEMARTGIFPASIASDISPERLARFFKQESDGGAYQIHKSIRDMLVFSKHDVIKDPPFSKLDLVSCRNLLIYMDGSLQKKIIPLFHYALNRGGYLFLGSSENIGDFQAPFKTIDRKWKIYQRKKDISSVPVLNHLYFPSSNDSGPNPGCGDMGGGRGANIREMTERALLEHYAPAGVVVKDRGEIIYIHGRTGRYLEPAPGEASINILQMAREGLRREVTAALRKATTTRKPVFYPNLQVQNNGGATSINLTVRPLNKGDSNHPDFFLVTFEDLPPISAATVTSEKQDGSGPPDENPSQYISELECELQAKEEYIQAAIEELETSNEELKSTNEELQSANEELQSTNEELETSKEELQSVNEELSTVNAELQNTVEELSRANNDMNNLLAGTGVGTIFVDLHLHIQRFTPAVTQVINLISSDIGRPVGHIASNLVGYDDLVEDVRAVISELIPRQSEVQTRDGVWYLMRIRPYRTLENVIEGVVITFVDITEQKHLQESLRETEVMHRLAVVVRDSSDAISVVDFDGVILAWNPGAVALYGFTEAEALGKSFGDLVPESDREETLNMLKGLDKGKNIEQIKGKRIRADGTILDVILTASVLVNEDGRAYSVAATERRIDRRPRTE